MKFSKKETIINEFIDNINKASAADDVWSVGLKPFAKRVGLQFLGLGLLAAGWVMFSDNTDLSSQQYAAMKAVSRLKGGEF